MWPPDETERAAIESALEAEYDENDKRNEILADLSLSESQLSECSTHLDTGIKSVTALEQLICPDTTSRGFRMPKDREEALEACTSLAEAPLTLGRRWPPASRRSRNNTSAESMESKKQKVVEHLATIEQTREELLPIVRRVDISVASAEDYTALTKSLKPWMEHLGIETVESESGTPIESTGETEREMVPLPKPFKMSIEDVLTDGKAKFTALTEFLAPWKKYVESVESAKSAKTAETVKSVGSVATTE